MRVLGQTGALALPARPPAPVDDACPYFGRAWACFGLARPVGWHPRKACFQKQPLGPTSPQKNLLVERKDSFAGQDTRWAFPKAKPYQDCFCLADPREPEAVEATNGSADSAASLGLGHSARDTGQTAARSLVRHSATDGWKKVFPEASFLKMAETAW